MPGAFQFTPSRQRSRCGEIYHKKLSSLTFSNYVKSLRTPLREGAQRAGCVPVVGLTDVYVIAGETKLSKNFSNPVTVITH